MASDWIALFPDPLPVDDAMAFAADGAAGGIASFLGTTRAESDAKGRALLALDYEAYGEMALKQLHDLGREARARWPIVKLVILHRTGRVGLKEASVLIVISTAHRAQAFDACRWVIDTLKEQVAIWKKEIWSDGGESWVHPK